MPLGSPYLTGTSPEAAATQPGMAYFADTGPFGATCGGCAFKNYTRLSSRETFNARNGEFYHKSYRVSGCRKFYEMTGKHGPEVEAVTHACRYFDEKNRPPPAPPVE